MSGQTLVTAAPAGEEVSAKSLSVNRGVSMEVDVSDPTCAHAEPDTWDLCALESYLSRKDEESM